MKRKTSSEILILIMAVLRRQSDVMATVTVLGATEMWVLLPVTQSCKGPLVLYGPDPKPTERVGHIATLIILCS